MKSPSVGDNVSASIPAARATGSLRRLLHAGQVGVDALDRGVRLVEVHLDDEFHLVIVGHVRMARDGAYSMATEAPPRTPIIGAVH